MSNYRSMKITSVDEARTTTQTAYFVTEPPLDEKYMAEFLRLIKNGGCLSNYVFREIDGMLMVTSVKINAPIFFSDEAKKTLIALLEGADKSLVDAAAKAAAKTIADQNANKKEAEQIARQFGVLLSKPKK